MNDPSTRRVLVLGWILLAVFLPLGMTLEALHALKCPVYLGSAVRRELWTLAHAHGNLLGILCLVFASLAERAISDAAARRTIARSLSAGAIAMPVGFFLGGILNSEGDPSLGILLVPLGGIFLLHGLLRAALAAKTPADSSEPR
ncbi:MAG TPA: hypothetical protein VM509_06610 [Planctomycetota bacterium]|nr:hypothetical protein [Planctomycetota bacterium]